MKANVVLYAPSVHTGGGLVLLKALLKAWPSSKTLTAFLDIRARDHLMMPLLAKVTWVEPRIVSRLMAEFSLSKASYKGDCVLCFHGLPPVLPNAGRVVVFQQNRNYLGIIPLAQFSFKTRLRLIFERAVSRFFRTRVAEFIVQTPSMQQALKTWYGKSEVAPLVSLYPFADTALSPMPVHNPQPQWDFIYVADGEAHKNHRNLLEAWRLLALENLRPTLAITLPPRNLKLKNEIETMRLRYNLKVTDLGQLSHQEIFALYLNSRAMVFPSTSESFGLPLIEATQSGLPIVASELDFIRDVCQPAQSFDPQSPVSISRAIKRFLNESEPHLILHTAEDFWQRCTAHL